MSNYKAVSIDGDEFFIVENWAKKLANFLGGHNLYDVPADSCYIEVSSWIQKHIVLTGNRQRFYSWYTDGLYTHGDDGIVRLLSDLNVDNRKDIKRKTYGVEASAILEVSEPFPDFVIDNLESIIVSFMANFKIWSHSDVPPVNLRKIKFAENTSAFFCHQ